ncbi:heterokaryon incompatibility protein-domain-containing protein [Paraphoma chrysanthemicola]|nr:heterokaryon incompatibility protein-domain-containing protein [Paraphoma chrysanthemicola]
MQTEYCCLSYVWGKSRDSQPIILNTQLFNVRGYLHDFLDHASRSGFTGPMWIDAVCIDQRNIAERGHQVQRMGDIYSRAQEVMIWLGKHIEIRETGEWMRTPQYCDILKPFPDKVEDQLNAICFHAYWSRAWIAQEILLQSNVRIVHPEAHFLWADFGLRVLYLQTWKSVEKSPVLRLMEMWLERYERRIASRMSNSPPSTWYSEHNQPETISFWMLLENPVLALCMDKRDRVYSLLAITNRPSGSQPFVVTYEIDTLALFCRVSNYFDAWSDPRRVNILSQALCVALGHLKSWFTVNHNRKSILRTWSPPVLREYRKKVALRRC